MDAIKLLRQRAADKRDNALKAARAEFRNATRLIDQLDETLGREAQQHKPRRGRKSNVTLIAEVMPKDRTFTIHDVMGLLASAHRDRSFNVATIRSEFTKLIDRGLIRRVRKTAKGCVEWAAADCEVEEEPIAAMSIVDAAALVLEERGPLTTTEIVVALKERWYRPDADPRALLTTLRDGFKRCRRRFHRGEGGKWVTV